MRQDVLKSMLDTLATVPAESSEWTCVGVVPTRADSDFLRAALANWYEMRAEPFEEDTAATSTHHWVHGARHWEVWVRPV